MPHVGVLLNATFSMRYFHCILLELIGLPFIISKRCSAFSYLVFIIFLFLIMILCQPHKDLLCMQSLVSSQRLKESPMQISGAYSLDNYLFFSTLACRFQPPLNSWSFSLCFHTSIRWLCFTWVILVYVNVWQIIGRKLE